MGAEPAEIVDERRHFGPQPAPANQPPVVNVPADVRARPPSLRGLWQRLPELLEEEWERGTAFLFLPVAMAAGALTYFNLEEEPGAPVLVVLLSALAALLPRARSRLLAHAALAAALMFLAGMLAAKVASWQAATVMAGSEVATSITGRVVQIEHQASGRVRLTLDVLATDRPRLRYAPARMRLSARAVPGGLLPGALVEGRARLMPLSGPVRPGSYDFAFNGYFDGIGAVGFFYRDPAMLADVPGSAALSPGQAAALWIENLRLSLAERVRARIGGAEGEIAATLIAGVRAGIPEETVEALRKTGLAHILAISGLHMALVSVTVLLAFRAVFAFMPNFSSRHPVKKYAALAALLACAFYLAVSGGAVAAQRSFVMLAVMLVALIFDRAALTMRNLAIAALIVIAIAPHEVTGPSFQMSFAATAALIGVYAMWSDWRAGRPVAAMPPAERPLALRAARLMLLYAAGIAMTSIIAGAATALYGAYHFHRVPPLALIANLAAMPIVSILVMPLAVLSVVAMPLGLDGFLLDAMGLAIGCVLAVAHWVAERSPFDVVGIVPTGAVLLMTVALVLLTLPTTVLRFSALLPALAAVWLMAERQLPHVLVSEDGRLVGVVTPDGSFAVNRDRPNAFTVDNWVRAIGKEAHLGPAAARRSGVAGFGCDGAACTARAASGALVVHAADASAAAPHCASAALVVIDDATAGDPCDGRSTVLTKRDLALRGSAAVTFTTGGPVVEHAIREPHRAWHDHRRFSREARGLPPREAN